MTQATSDYIYALFHTVSDDGLSVLLVRRHLLRNWVGGKRCQANVPNWAGQWGLVAARPLVTQAVEQTVQGAVFAQTGIDLSDAENTERYRVVNTDSHTLTDANGENISVLLLTCLPEGLAAIAEDAAANIAQRKVDDGVLAAAEIHTIADALPMVAPCAEPRQGWRKFLAGNGLGGLLGNGIKTLAEQLQERSQMLPNGALTSLGVLAQLPMATRPLAPSLKELRVPGARQHPSGGWYQTWSPEEMVLVQAVAEPADSPVIWQGGRPDPQGRPDWRAIPRDQISEPGKPFCLSAQVGDELHEVQVMIVPELRGVQVESLANGQDGLRLCALVEPDEVAAFKHLRWSGGQEEPGKLSNWRLFTGATQNCPQVTLGYEV